jgi:hypothetical protein
MKLYLYLFMLTLRAANVLGIHESQHVLLDHSSSWLNSSMQDTEDFIQEKMRDWHTPGLSIAVIDGYRRWIKVKIGSCLPFISEVFYTAYSLFRAH